MWCRLIKDEKAGDAQPIASRTRPYWPCIHELALWMGHRLPGGMDAVVGMNRGREVRRSANLIRARRPVDPEVLRQDVVDLKALGANLLHASRTEGNP